MVVMGFFSEGLELRTEENEEKGVTGDGVGNGLESERGEFAFHITLDSCV